MAERSTVSGQTSIYDAQLGKATFLWQAIGQQKPDLNLITAENRNQYAADFYMETLTGISSRKNSAVSAVMVNLSEQKRGSITAKYKQQVNGIEVFNREYNVLMDKEHNLVASSGYFAETSSAKDSLVTLATFTNIEQSIKKAFNELAGINVSLQKIAEEGGYAKYQANSLDDSKVVLGTPRAKKVFFEVAGELKSAYYIEIEVSDVGSLESDYYSYVVDSNNSKVYFAKDLKGLLTID